MLITNYAEHQDAAEKIGALRGFGKMELNSPETLKRLEAALADKDSTFSRGACPSRNRRASSAAKWGWQRWAAR